MIDFMFTMGQVAAAMLMIYGAMLSIGSAMSAQRGFRPTKVEDPLRLLKPLQNDA